MKITVACVGKIKEVYLREGIQEYAKRLSRYCRLEWYEVADERTPDGASAAQEEKIRDTEGNRLLRGIPDSSYVIALSIQGRMMDSPELAGRISDLGSHGVSHLVFVIGGSLGLSEKVMKRADFSWSFSKLTFPHQLMRLMLLEQIYRGYRIMSGEPYHK